MTTNFDVPYNGDPELIDFYIQHKDSIKMVYWRAEDWYPQWRKTSWTAPITIENIITQNKKLVENGITFNYLLNGTSHWNKEYEKEYRDNFLEHIRIIKDKWISMVTIWNLFLLEAVINEIPDIDVASSILLEVDNLTKLKTLVDMWVRTIFLSKVLLKNFNALKNIHQYNLKHPDLKLYLLANDPCLNHCIYTNYHNETLSLLTWNNKTCTSFCRLKCTNKFVSDPWSIISASFLRPEDLYIYEELWHNHIKLCDRKQTTEWIKRMFTAYYNRKYNWLLSDIMAPWSKNNGEYPETEKISEKEFIAKWIDNFRDQLRFTPKINNKELDWYLNFWLKNKPEGCANEDCEKCWYCNNVAKKANIWCTNDNLKNNINIAIKSIFKS